MIHLVTITGKERFWNIHQKYLYEMTQFYDDKMDEEGNYHYGHFDSYFENDPDRKALYMVSDRNIVGFALINRYSHVGNDIDYAMAEFTIFPVYRKNNYGSESVKRIFSVYSGKWEIKYNLKNYKAVRFWTKATREFMPEVINLNEDEQIICFSTI
ncbi:MAG: GNAT family N-acetyltransferase [Clostridia bacterium]|nr:GNAT family N-acetyltransferase [Clostridia bacterium]